MGIISYIRKKQKRDRLHASVARKFDQCARELETYKIRGEAVDVVSIPFHGTPDYEFMRAVEQRLQRTLGFSRLHWDSCRKLLVATR